MIIIELICAAGNWLWHDVIKPLIRFLYWLITARDCRHCTHSYLYRTWMNHYVLKCDINDTECCCVECYHSITRKDFERDK